MVQSIEELQTAIKAVQTKLAGNQTLTEEDLKLLLAAQLMEEESNELKSHRI